MKKIVMLLAAVCAVGAFASELELGVTVNGVDVGDGPGEGWYYDATTRYVEVTDRGAYVLSGTNTSGQVMFSIDSDAEVTLSNLCLRCTTADECCFWATNDVNVTLFLAGTNTLDASANGEGICIENDTHLTITNAPGFADEDAVLIAKGGETCAAIAVAVKVSDKRAQLTIAGGTIKAWAGAGAAGIGGSFYNNWTYGGYVTDIDITGGCVEAYGGDSRSTGGISGAGAGIGSAANNYFAATHVTISGGRVAATGGYNAAGIGGGCDSLPGSVTVSGGTVFASRGNSNASDMICGYSRNSGTFRITGGSICLANGVTRPSPKNAREETVWCVTVTNLEANATATVTGLDGYGTKDVVADGDGKIYLWLPNGSYGFSVNGAYYVAEVQDANVIATRFSGVLTGVTVNGIDAGFGSGKGWTFAAKWLKISSPGEYVLSGSATDFGVEIISDATVTLDNLCIKAPEMTGGGGVIKMLTPETDVNLLLSGTNKLELAAGSKAAGINVRFAKLTIDNAPGCRGSLTVTGGWYGAGIGGYCSENGEIVINGGDITATGREGSAGIGSGYYDSSRHANGPITINGGRIVATGNKGGRSIGCPKNRGDGAPIRITGGTVIAKDGIGASEDYGNGCTNTFTGGSIDVGGKPLYRWPVDGAEASVWCVTVTNLAPNATATVTGLDGYGTKDVVADGDGKIYLWLPNGSYYFSVNGAYYVAEVQGANTTATQVVGLPVTPGVKAGPYETAAAATNAARTAYVLPRKDVAAALATDAARSAYAQMFGFIVTGEGVIWSVEAELTPPAWSNLVESAAAATRQVPVADIATGAETSFTATNCVPGFFYSLRSGTKLDTLSTDGSRTNVLCGAGKSVAPGEVPFGPVAKPSDAVGFFTVGVQVAP